MKTKTRKSKNAVGSGLSFSFDTKAEGVEPFLGAAYLMMDRAYAFIEGDGKKSLRVTLRLKAGRGAAAVAGLKRAFENELAAQKLRWAVARNNREVREYVAENALALAAEFAARPAAAPAEPACDALTAEQRSEIERLIAEVETEISQMTAPKAPAGSKSAALSWEEVHEKKEGGRAA